MEVENDLVEKGLIRAKDEIQNMVDILVKETYNKYEVAEILEDFKKSFSSNISNYDRMLKAIGLSTGFDLLLFDVAKMESRQRIQTLNANYSLHLLFQMETEETLLHNPKVAPNAVFIEQKRNLIKTIKGEVEDVQGEDFFVVWFLKMGSSFEKPMLSFNEFHKYATLNVKSAKNLSLEKLYKTIEKRRGEIYFLTNGAREDFGNEEKLIVIFVTPFNLIVYELPTVDWNESVETFVSQWVHPNAPIRVCEIQEVGIYEFPTYQIVQLDDSEEKKEQNFSTPGLDTYVMEECEGCGS